MSFEEFGLDDKILEAISYMGYEKASEIQALTIPAILDGDDILACAQTGTGKTAAFMLPIMI
jgi:ATP-dependent RNA helicase RhlE